MPSWRCVVQDCSNISDILAGLSLHKRPIENIARESGLNLFEQSAQILTREKYDLWFARITFPRSVLNGHTT